MIKEYLNLAEPGTTAKTTVHVVQLRSVEVMDYHKPSNTVLVGRFQVYSEADDCNYYMDVVGACNIKAFEHLPYTLPVQVDYKLLQP